uniref:BED-type domain-containing protein n=1 Tax=Anguilla anguilla TaxID=7936 RepID=A0A0E9VGD5_ANGAN
MPKLSYHSSTSTMLNHMRLKHPEKSPDQTEERKQRW